MSFNIGYSIIKTGFYNLTVRYEFEYNYIFYNFKCIYLFIDAYRFVLMPYLLHYFLFWPQLLVRPVLLKFKSARDLQSSTCVIIHTFNVTNRYTID